MKNTKRLIALILALVMLLGVFSACAVPTEEPTVDPTTTPIVTPTPTEEPIGTPNPTESAAPTETPNQTMPPVATQDPTPTESPAPTDDPTPTKVPEPTPYPSIDPVLTSDPTTWPQNHEAITGFMLAAHDEAEAKAYANNGLIFLDHEKKECWLGTIEIAAGANHEEITHLVIPSTYNVNGEEYTVVGLAWDLMGWNKHGSGGRGFGTADKPDEHDCWVQTVYIPKTVRYIDYQVFYTFGSIENIVFEDMSTLEYMDVLAFRKTKFEENSWIESETEMHIVGDWLCWVAGSGDIQIPTGVKHICGRIFNSESGEDLFRNFIETITIPETVTDIHKKAFDHLDGAEFVFKVKQGSYADTWLQEKGYTNIEYFE